MAAILQFLTVQSKSLGPTNIDGESNLQALWTKEQSGGEIGFTAEKHFLFSFKTKILDCFI